MVHYKLTYFNLRARGELARWCFLVAGVEFEDDRIPYDPVKWVSETKATIPSPFGQLPILKVTDGDKEYTLAQSIALARFIGKKYNLAGKTEQEQAELEMYADQITDLSNEYAKTVFEKDEEKKKELTDKLTTETIPKNFTFFETKLAKTNSGYLTSELSWVDLYLGVLFDWMGEKKVEPLKHFPKLKEHNDKILSIPKLAEWIAKRPDTPM